MDLSQIEKFVKKQKVSFIGSVDENGYEYHVGLIVLTHGHMDHC